MRVLFHTYDFAFQRKGGGEKVIDSLQCELLALGLQVDIFDPWTCDPGAYDLVHYFSTRQCEYWAFHQRHFQKVPLVVTPTLTGMASRSVTSSFFARFSEKKYRPYFRIPLLFFPATAAEGKELQQRFLVDQERIKVLPNGIQANLAHGDAQLIREKLKLSERPLVLCVGRVEPVKNQLLLIRALSQMENVESVFIGDTDPGSESYALQCRAEAIKCDRIHFLPGKECDSTLLASAYAAAHAYVQPSAFETFGLAALEARAAGCNLALTSGMAEPAHFGGEAVYFSPKSVAECAAAVRKTLLSPRRHGHREEVVRRYAWAPIALELKAAYSEALSRGTTCS